MGCGSWRRLRRAPLGSERREKIEGVVAAAEKGPSGGPKTYWGLMHQRKVVGG